MSLRGRLGFVGCGAGLLLIGCGGGTPAAVAPSVSPLAGNWLIVGPMPTNEFSFPPVPSGFRLAMTFDVTGSNVTAAGFANGSCTSTAPPGTIVPTSFSFGSLAVGTVAADGSFTLQTPANLPIDSISIQGKIPLGNQGQFSGSYTSSYNSPIGAGCVGNFAGMFTATSFPLVSGIYAGTGSTLTNINGVSGTTPITVQVNLQQGGTVKDPVTGISTPSSIELAGSIRIQGSPCFTSGVTGATPASSVQGNRLLAEFTMDDGSTLSLLGTLTDSTEAHISTGVLLVTASGKCATVPTIYQLSGLDRQS